MMRPLTCTLCLLTMISTTAVRAQETAPVKEKAANAPAAAPTVQEKIKAPTPAPALQKKRARVQMAILLDTSSSMNGLIHQTKTQLWQVVNEFATAKRGGQSVDFELAFYEYGKNTIPKQNQFVRKILPLTNNLDEVSKQLHALKTASRSGGDEWPGVVIQHAVRDLAWSTSGDDLKVIFVAGNESFSQGPVDYRVSCKEAISKGIIVNTIHCGNHATGISNGWKDGSRLADGSYTSIDQNRTVAQVAAPQDAKILKLNSELNRTYVPFGRLGQEGSRLQTGEDKNAEKARDGSVVERARTKSSSLYDNASWDLVDAFAQGKVKLDKLDKKKLPAALQKLSTDECEKYLKGKAAERRDLQKQIQTLYSDRSTYLKKKRAPARSLANNADPSAERNSLRKSKSAQSATRRGIAQAAAGAAEAAPKDLGSAIIDTLKEQAKKKDIQVGEEKKPEPKKPEPKKDDPKPQVEKKPESPETSKESTETEGDS